MSCQGLDLAGLGLNAVGVDGGQEIADDVNELDAAAEVPRPTATRSIAESANSSRDALPV